MLCKADFPIFPLPECLCFFLYLIRLEFPVDLVMCLFHHTCLSTSQKWGNKCSQEKYPFPCLKPLDICSILVSPQASLPFITLLLLFFFIQNISGEQNISTNFMPTSLQFWSLLISFPSFLRF